jgi:transposase-like protein
MSSAALAAYRKARAVELALAGYSYDAIAHELGLANRGTAWHLVQNALRERRFAAVDAYREAELERLRQVEEQLWPRVMAGDVRAAAAMRVVINQRVRLLGLDQVATRESNRCTCTCPIHGSHGSWRPTLRPEDAPFVEEPSADLIAEVEERMEAWAEETGVWLLFTVMTAIAQVMEMVRDAGDLADEAPA